MGVAFVDAAVHLFNMLLAILTIDDLEMDGEIYEENTSSRLGPVPGLVTAYSASEPRLAFFKASLTKMVYILFSP